MAKFIIEGNHPISGVVRTSGNKNAALPILCASVMADGDVWIRNVPRIGDVATLVALLENMGVRFARQGDYDLLPIPSGLMDRPLDPGLCRMVRGSVLLAVPMLHRFGRVDLPFPGGDKIGRRRIDTHLMALEAMGARISAGPSSVIISAPRDGLQGADILLDEASVTATENAVMGAALARGASVIRNAACEPHVQELCRFLNQLGADISGIGTNAIRVNGVRSLARGSQEATLGPDYLEAASLMALAVITGGELTIQGVVSEDMRMILFQFRRLGMAAEMRGDDLYVPARQPRRVQRDFRGAVPTVASSTWPSFPADLTSIALVAATQMEGSVMIHEKMFESRLFFVDQLLDMGAQVVLCDPHRAVAVGPSALHGSRMHSPDIRAGMALLAAALAARGESVIENVTQIDRGYERIDERLRLLGAKIEKGD
ncbi:MAG: UDP-N-acetylglucosamine 1-carboxyvinyltransferase [Planctomycetota bacterium]|jgi:UDP-N-acetylglucosamine 1-carboxyvinyltransferase|nr:UDP-N-acetylglucosamine 1-carboxyvinyltransferase [Planctomycetota bacterium]